MQDRDQRGGESTGGLENMFRATQAHDAICAIEQGLGWHAARGNNHFRSDQFHHPIHKRTTYGELLGFRIAVGRGAPVIHIGNEGIFRAVTVNGRQHLVEQLSGLAHKGQALAVLFGARSFADHHQAGTRRAIIDDCIF